MRANVVFRSVQCSKMSHRVACCSYTMERLLLMTRPGVCSRSEVSVVPEGFLISYRECWKQAMTEIFQCISWNLTYPTQLWRSALGLKGELTARSIYYFPHNFQFIVSISCDGSCVM